MRNAIKLVSVKGMIEWFDWFGIRGYVVLKSSKNFTFGRNFEGEITAELFISSRYCLSVTFQQKDKVEFSFYAPDGNRDVFLFTGAGNVVVMAKEVMRLQRKYWVGIFKD